VLEIACGTGRVAIRLARDGVNIVGLDLSPERLVHPATQLMRAVSWLLISKKEFKLTCDCGNKV
jgi:ubiquinone/menaquinone biosynthesis C-methylase UbiE